MDIKEQSEWENIGKLPFIEKLFLKFSEQNDIKPLNARARTHTNERLQVTEERMFQRFAESRLIRNSIQASCQMSQKRDSFAVNGAAVSSLNR